MIVLKLLTMITFSNKNFITIHRNIYFITYVLNFINVNYFLYLLQLEFEKEIYYIQHILMLIVPVYLLRLGGKWFWLCCQWLSAQELLTNFILNYLDIQFLFGYFRINVCIFSITLILYIKSWSILCSIFPKWGK